MMIINTFKKYLTQKGWRGTGGRRRGSGGGGGGGGQFNFFNVVFPKMCFLEEK